MAQTLLSLKGITKTYRDQEILSGLDLDVNEGEFLTLLGPSGCGKTTLLRLIGGFENADSGAIVLDGRELSELPPHLRATNTVFQSYALFPHMSVFENVAFGLKMKKLPSDEIVRRVGAVLATVQLGEHAHKKPSQLSGGQQQRVAIARAVVNNPRILLLDEPLSALDYKLRKAMQIELKQLQRRLGITFLFVTHDQEEALSMSDRIVVMQEGRIEQIGSPREIYESPRTLFVARFIGEVNIFECALVSQNGGIAELHYADTVLRLTCVRPLNARVHVLIRPEDLRVERRFEDVKSANFFRCRLEEIIYKGTTIDLLLRLDNGGTILASEFYNEESDALGYTIGAELYVYWVEGWEVILDA